MKKLLKVKQGSCESRMYGFYQNNATYINVGLLWKKNRKVSGFIQDFIDTAVHETVHLLISKERKRKFYKGKALKVSSIGEEYVVVALEENSEVGSLQNFRKQQSYGRNYSSKPKEFYIKL